MSETHRYDIPIHLTSAIPLLVDRTNYRGVCCSASMFEYFFTLTISEESFVSPSQLKF